MGSMTRLRSCLQDKMGLPHPKANAVASAMETLHQLGDAMANATWEWTGNGRAPEVMIDEAEAELSAARAALDVLKLELL